MKVGIYTNLTDRCGNAEDAKYLHSYLSRMYDEPVAITDNLTHLYDRDVVIVNWHSAVVRFLLDDANALKARSIKTLLIHQNSSSGVLTEADTIVTYVNKIVAHEEMGPLCTYIPVGIPEVLELPQVTEPKVGTAGFAFAWKRFDVVVEVARNFNIKCCMVTSNSFIQNTDAYVDGLAGHIPNLIELHRSWLPVDEVVKLLAQCSVNIFWYQSKDESDTWGQTGSARMGLAAGRPMIISRHRKFRTLWPYEDELYIADTEQQVNDFVGQILKDPENARKPNRVLQDMNWTTVANKYKEVIDSL